jgi:hypothetical protein
MGKTDINRRTLLQTGLAVPAGLALFERLGPAAAGANENMARENGPLPFRQVHLDFHTSEKITGVGEKFDPDEFASTLSEAGVNSVTCFGRCHHGYIYYDTKRFPERRHPHLKRNLLKEQIEACHCKGIRVPIYSTIQWDHFTANEHPEWLMRDEKGQVVGQPPGQAGFYRRLCMNSPYAEFIKRHLTELFEVVPVDGLFLDIVHEVECVCQFCRAGMRARGLDPSKQPDRAAYAKHVNVTFKRELTAHIRRMSEDCTIFYNAGHVGPYIRDSLDSYTHLEMESLPGGSWGYMHFPLTARYVRTLGKPYLGMTGRFHTSWGDFHSYKNRAALEFECFNMLALGARCSIGDQLHPSGEMDQATYDLIGSVYRQVRQKEPWCRNATPLADVALMSAEEFVGGRMPPPSVGAIRMLQEGAHQFDVVDSRSELDDYKLLVLPDKITLDGPLAAKIRRFVKDGGAVLASFESGLDPAGDQFVLEEFGVRNASQRLVDGDGDSVYGRSYYRNDYAEYIMPTARLGEALPRTEHVMHIRGLDVELRPGAEALLEKVEPYFDRTPEHFCSHRQTPSSGKIGGPAAVRNGNLVYFSSPIFTQYHANAPRWCRELILDAVDLLLPEPLVRLEAPSTTIATVTEQPAKGRWVLHLVHYIPERRGQAFDVIEDVIPVRDVKVSIRLPKQVRAVRTVPQGHPLSISLRNGRAEFVVPSIRGHQMIELAS